MKKFLLSILSAMILTTQAQASPLTQQAAGEDDRLFTEEQVFRYGREYADYASDKIRLAWWGDELVRINDDNCMIVNKKNGKETVLFTKDDVDCPLTDVAFIYPDEPILATFCEDGEGSMTLYDFKKKQIVWKVDVKDCAARSFARKTRNYAYVSGGNLYIIEGKDAAYDPTAEKHEPKPIVVTTDGNDDSIVYGQAVHRNEWGIYRGLFWSPDGKKLAFYRMDQSMVQKYPLPTFTVGNRVKNTQTRYPMAGDVSHKVTIGVYNTETKTLQYLNTGDPTDRYFTNIQWCVDSKNLWLFEINREQDTMKLDIYNTYTGDFVENVYHEENEKYVQPMHPVEFLPWDCNFLIMQTRRNGYNHLYLYDVKGKLIKQLTEGDYEVTNVLGFCPEQHTLIYTSRQASPLCDNLYAVNLDTYQITSLDNGKGIHAQMGEGMLSMSGKYIIDQWNTHDTMNNMDLITLGKKGKVQTLSLLAASNKWSEKGKRMPIVESGTIKAADGKTDLYYRMVKPYNFDPAKKYPAVVYVYGGPNARNVDDTWQYGMRPWEIIMSQKQYVIFVLDNRGSEGRGLEFEQAIWHQLGKVEMEDQMKGVEFLTSHPFIDTDRLGVHGWSYGGFMTCSLMTTYPDIFKVGVAGGPVIDWKWYEVMYGERYMGTPQNNPEGYKNSSLLNKAQNLKGRLLVITGGSDPTVVPQNCINFLNAAEENDKLVDFYIFPDQGHNMTGHSQVTLHQRITRYFEDFLK